MAKNVPSATRLSVSAASGAFAPNATKDASMVVLPPFSGVSPLAVIREHVISCLHYRVACESALGIVSLRWVAGQGTGRERVGRGVIVEHGISPSTAILEPLAVLHHEVDVMQRRWHRRCRERLQLFRVVMDLRHLGAVGKRLAVAGN